MKKINCFIFLLLTLSSYCSAQVTIDFPRERQIFQRHSFHESSNFQGDGSILITGNFTVKYDSIMARVEPRSAGQGTATSWTKINTENGKPYFKGEITAKGGWYTLYIDAFHDGVSVGTDTVERVGIGEVFAIAGQSNAQGGGELTGVPGTVAIDDRVNSINFSHTPVEDNKLAIGFSKIDVDSNSIGPFHYVSWAWANLGDRLASNLNVPILFYGAGHGGTAVLHWSDASQGIITPNIPLWLKMELGAPYKALAVTLKYYASLTGIRAVLWHQGESDHGTNSNDYRDRLQTVIAESREDIESSTLAWMVAKASYAGGGTSANPVFGQILTINADANVFDGPDTDIITGNYYRSDLTHMNTLAGQEYHAYLWFNSLTSSNRAFFQNSIPVPPKEFIDVNFTCSPGSPSSPITLATAGSYVKHAWSNRDNTTAESIGTAYSGDSTFTKFVPSDYLQLNWQYDSTGAITVSPGKYALNVTKATSGVVLFSPLIDLTALQLSNTPNFSSSATQIRAGDSVTLTATNCNGSYAWNTGSSINPLLLYPSTTDNYSVSCKSLYCPSAISISQQIIVSSCFANALNLTGTISNTESPYSSQQNIQSIQTVDATGKIDYTADESVILNPGFSANAGSVFKATIENCP